MWTNLYSKTRKRHFFPKSNLQELVNLCYLMSIGSYERGGECPFALFLCSTSLNFNFFY